MAADPPADAGQAALVRMPFVVHGKVQRVFFRVYTKRHADSLGVTGWCRNTPEGTVVGVAEGPAVDVAHLRQWLEREGSPNSRIDRLEAPPAEPIDARTYTTFEIDKSFGHAPRTAPSARTGTTAAGAAVGAGAARGSSDRRQTHRRAPVGT